MDQKFWKRTERLFHQLHGLKPNEQQKQLEQLRTEDARLADELALLLQNADQTLHELAGQIESRALDLIGDVRIGPGEQLGEYRLVKELGRGGMGVVFLANREHEFSHDVAIKIVNRTLDTAHRERFLTERQILAQLNHPNIARLLGGGTTESGMPYIIMEYVDGQPLHEHCREQRVSLLDGLDMMKKICHSVSFAHQHLVIHRDIKPQNILVDTNGEPKLLDFGIAQPIKQGETQSGKADAMAWTPGYASPEQVRAENATTATDIYALGLLLYELVTGVRAQNVTPSNRAMIEQVVCEQTPKPLIEAITDGPAKRPFIAQQFLAKPRLWQQDLENIIFRCLAKDPGQRYFTVQALSDDLDRLVKGDAVLATPPSFLYRLKKQVRKYRFQFAAGFITLVTAVAFVAGLIWSTRVAEQARQDADRRLAQSKDLIEFMLGDLRSRLKSLGRLDVLEAVGEKALDFFAELPLQDTSTEVSLNNAKALRQIGEVNLDLGNPEQATTAFQRSLDISEAVVVLEPNNQQALFDLSNAAFWLGYLAYRDSNYDQSRTAFNRYQQIAERLTELDPDNPEWQMELSYAHANLGSLNEAQADIDAAIREFTLSAELKRKLVTAHPDRRNWTLDLSDTLSWLGRTQLTVGKLRDAQQYFSEVVDLNRQVLNPRPEDTRAKKRLVQSLYWQGLVFAQSGRDILAFSALNEALTLSESLTQHDPANLDWWELVPSLHYQLGQYHFYHGEQQLAHKHYQQSLETSQRLLDGDADNLSWQRFKARALSGLAETATLVEDHRMTYLKESQEILTRLREAQPKSGLIHLRELNNLLIEAQLLPESVNHENSHPLWRQLLEQAELDIPNSEKLTVAFYRVQSLIGLQRLDEAQRLSQELLQAGYLSPPFRQLLGQHFPQLLDDFEADPATQ